MVSNLFTELSEVVMERTRERKCGKCGGTFTLYNEYGDESFDTAHALATYSFDINVDYRIAGHCQMCYAKVPK